MRRREPTGSPRPGPANLFTLRQEVIATKCNSAIGTEVAEFAEGFPDTTTASDAKVDSSGNSWRRGLGDEVKGEPSGVGVIAGGVTGAVVGSQIGRGDTSTLMAVAGAAGGALAGNEIEKHVKKRTVYRVAVKMDDGTARTVSLASAPALAVGDRVRVQHGTVERV
jgi:hypothetical protein